MSQGPSTVYYKGMMWIRAGVVNKLVLRSLIYQAMGDRNISRFSRDCGVNPSTISRILRGISQPSFDTLCSIQEHACYDCDVTLENLMFASGYGVVNDIDNLRESTSTLLKCIDAIKKNNKASSIKPNSKKFKPDCEFIMINHMIDKGYGIKKPDLRLYEYPFDFMLDIDGDDTFKTWCFKFMDNSLDMVLDALDELIDACHRNSFYDRGVRVSFVINNKMCFDTIRRTYSNIEIHDYVSIILVYQTTLQVVDEFVINQKQSV